MLCIFVVVVVAAVVSGAPRDQIADKTDVISARDGSFDVQEGEMADNRTTEERLRELEISQEHIEQNQQWILKYIYNETLPGYDHDHDGHGHGHDDADLKVKERYTGNYGCRWRYVYLWVERGGGRWMGYWKKECTVAVGK